MLGKKIHQPCPCGKSSDAYCINEDGSSHCYSCGKHWFVDKNIDLEKNDKLEKNYTKQIVPFRGLERETQSFFGVYSLVDADGTPKEVIYPHPSFDKHRILPKEGFPLYGKNTKAPEMFGLDKFNPGEAPAITITEGQDDAMAVFQMFGRKYPVCSVRSSGQAYKDCQANYEKLNSFDKIVLSFDSDEHGKKAAQQVATLFDFNKVYVVRLDKYKDANEALLDGPKGQDLYRRMWYSAKRFVPENILSTFEDFEKALDEKEQETLCTLPFTVLQGMLRGIRAGETLLFKAPEGFGKTEIMGAIEYHALTTTDFNIGVIHLEEPIRRTLQRFATYEFQKPVHLDKTVTKEETLEAVKKVSKRDNRIHFYKNFGSDDLQGIINNIRFLVGSCGCKLIFLDHISRLVSGIFDIDERKSLDFISTRLAQLADELQFGLIMITHVNDDGQTRGSRNISKEAAGVVSLFRDILNPDEVVRNTTVFTVEKNRYGSMTGPGGEIYFDVNTFCLSEDQPPNLPPVGE